MWKYIIIFVVCSCSLSAAYSVAPSRQIGHYHYSPPQGPRLELPQHSLIPSDEDYQPQQQLQRNYRQYSQQQQQQIVPQSVGLKSQGYNNAAAPLTDDSSHESIRLPLELGVASINVGPLPLSRGVSYSDRPGINSYGTTYPQRV